MTRTINETLLLTSSTFIKQKEFWLNKLTPDTSETKLLVNDKRNDRLVPDRITSGRIDLHFPDHIGSAVVKLGKQSDLAVYIILLAGLKALIYRYVGNEDITVISPVYEEYVSNDTMNDYVFIRDCINRDKTFKSLLLQIKQSVLNAYDHQDYPCERLLESLFNSCPTPDTGAISNVVCALKNLHAAREIEEKTDKLVFFFSRQGDRIDGDILFDPMIYQHFYIERMSRHFILLLENALQDIQVKISKISFLEPEERNRLIREFNRTEAEYPHNKTIHLLFEEQVKRTQDQVALIGQIPKSKQEGTRRHAPLYITYRELNKKANQLAVLLREKGVKPDTIVGLMMERSLEMIITLLGILKAGAAYLPITVDPGYPGERIHYMLSDCSVNILLRDSKYFSEFSSGSPWASWKGEVVWITPGSTEGMASPTYYCSRNENKVWQSLPQSPVQLCYVIYTSGTSGNPKGVMIEHGNAVNVVEWFARQYHLQVGIHLLQMSEYTFDASVNQIFGSLLHGAVLHVVPQELLVDMTALRRYINAKQIHIINFVPLLLNDLLTRGEKLESLQAVISGGEKLDDVSKDRIIQKGYTLYNQYGPTETTIDALMSKCTREKVNLGKPIANVKCYILDEYQNPLPIGVAGELYVSGAGLARGYLNNPELTAEKFKRAVISSPNKLSKSTNDRLYRTGDLVKWLSGGSVEFLGRIDQQVKFRGFRIELGEIEAHLLKYDRIKEGVVLAKEDDRQDQYLCAYIVVRPGFSTEKIRKYLAKSLPYYMIPAYFIQVEKMPLTHSGKIDKKALPDLVIKAGDMNRYIAPRNDTEKKLVNIYTRVLEIEEEKIGIRHNFFELGGNSMRVIILVSTIHKEVGVDLTITQIYNNPSIEEISAIIGKGKYVEKPMLLLSGSASTQKSLFCFPPGTALGISYQNFASSMPDYSVYSFNFIEEENRLEQYVELITDTQPVGPYILLGWSAGGMLAFEVAAALENHRREVSDIILLDTIWLGDALPVEKNSSGFRKFLSALEEEMERLEVGFLKDKVLQKVSKYLEYIGNLTPPPRVNAHVHYLFSGGHQPGEDRDRTIFWGKLSRKSLFTYNGDGEHNEMLDPGPLERNVKIIRDILKNISLRDKPVLKIN